MKGRKFVKVSPEFLERLLAEGTGASEPLEPMPDDMELVDVSFTPHDEFGRRMVVATFASSSWHNAEPEQWNPVFRRKGA